MSKRSIRALAVAVISTSCVGAESSQDRFTLAEGAAATTAYSRSPRWGSSLLSERVFEFGLSTGPEHLLFDRVSGVTRLEGGALAVGNRGSRTIRLFAEDGQLLKEFGGRGEGPGEFTLLRRVVPCQRGVITALDWNYRQVRFNRDGQLLDTWLVTLPGERLGVYRMSCNRTGRLVAFGWGNAGWLDHPVGSYEAEGGLYVAESPMGPFEQIGTTFVADRARLTEGEYPHPFGRTTSVAATQNGFVLGSAETYGFTVHTFDGDTSLVVRWDGPNHSLTGEDVSAYLEWRLTGADESEHPAIRREVSQYELPESLPAYSEIVVGSGGVVWVKEFDAPWRPSRRWWGFLPNGDWAWELELERDFEVTEFGVDEVLGVAVDDLDVETVRGYRMDLPRDST